MTTHIALPDERVEQLRAIAKAKNTTIPEIIATYVRSEIAAGTIPAGVPGVEVKREGDQMKLLWNDFAIRLDVHKGIALADALRGATKPLITPEGVRALVQALNGPLVKRAGNGVKIFAADGKTRALNKDIAVDLADQIDDAVK